VRSRTYDWFERATPEARDKACRELAAELALRLDSTGADFHHEVETFIAVLNGLGHGLVRFDYDDDPDKQVWTRDWRSSFGASGLIVDTRRDRDEEPVLSVVVSWSAGAASNPP
jgi:hypothetical protein